MEILLWCKSSRKVRRHLASPALGKTKAEQSSTKFFSSAGERAWSRVTNHFAPSIRKMLSARDPASPTSPPRKLVVLYTGSGFQVLAQLLVAKGYKSIHFYSLRLVLERGLEPPWGCPHYDLNVARLPISPLQQSISFCNTTHTYSHGATFRRPNRRFGVSLGTPHLPISPLRQCRALKHVTKQIQVW